MNGNWHKKSVTMKLTNIILDLHLSYCLLLQEFLCRWCHSFWRESWTILNSIQWYSTIRSHHRKNVSRGKKKKWKCNCKSKAWLEYSLAYSKVWTLFIYSETLLFSNMTGDLLHVYNEHAAVSRSFYLHTL